ncbi:MAG: hypothetical protein ACE5HX_07550, partial [bacterium]
MQKHGTMLMLRNRDFIRTLGVITIFLNLFSQNTGVLADEWDEIYEKGKLALEQGEWNQAIVNFQQALHIRVQPDHQATTTSLKLVEYLPYYYLGQAYLFASDYQAALESFQNSMNAGAVKNTANQPRLEKLIEITQRLIQSSEQKVPAAIRETEFETKLSEIQNLIYNENYIQALKSFEDLKRLSPEDKRLTIIYNWIQNEQQKSVFEPNHAELGNQAEERFHEGLDYFLLGQYEQALETFRTVEKIAPNFSVATSWIRKTQTEIERLKLDETKSQKEEALKPEVIEKIIKQTTAPVFAIRTPTEAVTEIRSKNLNLSGLAGDDQGIDYINLTVNGKPLLDTSGKKVMIQPQKNDNAKKFSFSTQIPLQMAENQIVLTAYDVDVPPHRTIEQFTVIRKRPIYQTTTFGISVGAIFLLGIGGLFISKMVKYRIAIVNKYNPYIAGSPIRTEEMFFGREKLLQRILNTLHNNSLMLYGPRRIGKT